MSLKNMCSFRDQLKMDGFSSSLEDSPCISVCSLTYGTGKECICGRNQNQIAQWNSYDAVTKKKIVMQSIKNKKSMPRQKLTFKAQDYGITFEKAKKVFVTDKL